MHFSAIVMDYVSKLTVFMRNGKEVDRIPLQTNDVDALARVIYFPPLSRLLLETHRGDMVTMRLPTPDDSVFRKDRPVIYLDQKDWSLLANVLHDPGRIRSFVERRSGERLISLVRDFKVILPMSFGHMVETSKWTNDEHRYRHALTLLEFSDGWQMRHPYDIRVHELRQTIQAFRHHEPNATLDVFTLAAGAMQPSHAGDVLASLASDLTPPDANVVRAITSLTSYASILLESEPTFPGPVTEWTQNNQAFTRLLAEQVNTSRDRKAVLAARFLDDLRPEILQAVFESGLGVHEFEPWLGELIKQDFSQMPSIGWFYATYVTKHRNRETKWFDNDLMDLMYPVTAAGYADYCVADKDKASLLLQAAKRRGQLLHVHTSIPSLLAVMDGDGIHAKT